MHISYEGASIIAFYDNAFGGPNVPSNLIAGTPPSVGPGGVSRLTKLGRYFSSLSQMSSKGKVIATSLRDGPRFVAMYGGKTTDWVKMSSATSQGTNGFKFATHWYKKCKYRKNCRIQN